MDPLESGEITIVERDDRRWWPLAVSVGTSVLSAILAASLCLTIQARNAERDREARVDLQRIQQEQRAALCALIIAQDDNYREFPASTELGEANARALADQRADPRNGCPPPIKE